MRRRFPHLVVVFALLGQAATPSPPPPAASPSPAASAQQLVNDVRAALGGDLAAGLAAQDELTRALQENASQQDSVRQSLQATGVRIAQLDASIAARQVQIDTTRARVTTERAELAALARALYRQPGSLLERLAASGSLADALTSTADLETAGRRGGELEATLAHSLAGLQAAQDEQQAERRREAELRTGQQRLLAVLAQMAAQEEQTGAALGSAIQAMRAELSAAGAQQADVADRVRQLLEAEQVQIDAAAQEEAWSQAALGVLADPSALALATSEGSTGGRLTWPLPQAVISQGFGPTDVALEPAYAGYAHFHTGIDLVAPAGSPVLAAADGVVAVAGSGTTGYGNFVVIAHAGGITTLYGHLAVALVAGGQAVVQGQPVGLEGSTGNSTGPHCHFEVRVAGQPVDPLPFLTSAQP